MARRPATIGTLLGLGAAISFGVSTPISKELLDSVSPQLLAGLLYLGAFLALAVLIPARRRSPEARIRRSDFPRLGALTLAGGIAAPVLLLVGLEQVQASTGSLLLNLEGPATLLLGVLVFREHLGRSAALGAGCIFAGAVVLTLPGDEVGGQLVGVLCIAAACGCWGLDNNLTQSLTVRDPFAIVTVKTGAAAAVNVSLAVALGAELPASSILLGALAWGRSRSASPWCSTPTPFVCSARRGSPRSSRSRPLWVPSWHGRSSVRRSAFRSSRRERSWRSASLACSENTTSISMSTSRWSTTICTSTMPTINMITIRARPATNPTLICTGTTG